MNKPNISYNNKLSDFEVVRLNILVDYNIQSTAVLGNGHYREGYEIYELKRFLWFTFRMSSPRVRLEALSEVNEWLLIETGESFLANNIISEGVNDD